MEVPTPSIINVAPLPPIHYLNFHTQTTIFLISWNIKQSMILRSPYPQPPPPPLVINLSFHPPCSRWTGERTGSAPGRVCWAVRGSTAIRWRSHCAVLSGGREKHPGCTHAAQDGFQAVGPPWSPCFLPPEQAGPLLTRWSFKLMQITGSFVVLALCCGH